MCEEKSMESMACLLIFLVVTMFVDLENEDVNKIYAINQLP
jgi:hypothetical protein